MPGLVYSRISQHCLFVLWNPRRASIPGQRRADQAKFNHPNHNRSRGPTSPGTYLVYRRYVVFERISFSVLTGPVAELEAEGWGPNPRPNQREAPIAIKWAKKSLTAPWSRTV